MYVCIVQFSRKIVHFSDIEFPLGSNLHCFCFSAIIFFFSFNILNLLILQPMTITPLWIQYAFVSKVLLLSIFQSCYVVFHFPDCVWLTTNHCIEIFWCEGRKASFSTRIYLHLIHMAIWELETPNTLIWSVIKVIWVWD